MTDFGVVVLFRKDLHAQNSGLDRRADVKGYGLQVVCPNGVCAAPIERHSQSYVTSTFISFHHDR